MKKPRLIFLATVSVASLLTLAGCTGPATTGSNTGSNTTSSSSSSGKASGQVDFFSASGQIPIIQSLADEVKTELTSRGFTFAVQDANLSPTTQAQQIQQAADTGTMVAAWIFPVAPEALAQSVKALQAKHIPIVVEAGPSDFGFTGAQPGIVFDSSDFTKYGTTIGQDAATCAVSKGGSQALFLTAPDTAGGAAAVTTSMKSSYTAGAPNVPIVGSAQAADVATAQTNVSQLLIAHPDANVVIAGTDENALGAVQAFKAAGKTAKCIIDGGGDPDALAAQKSGEITEIVAWNYTAAIKSASDDLQKLLADDTADGVINSVPITVVK